MSSAGNSVIRGPPATLGPGCMISHGRIMIERGPPLRADLGDEDEDEAGAEEVDWMCGFLVGEEGEEGEDCRIGKREGKAEERGGSNTVLCVQWKLYPNSHYEPTYI